LRAGKSRKDALTNFAQRANLDDVNNLVSLLIQTDRFGTSIAQALRVHADFMRVKRFQKAEEIAAKMPLKLIFPLVLFIFPFFLLIAAGPAVIGIFRAFEGR
jgi:tight adherence protein C